MQKIIAITFCVCFAAATMASPAMAKRLALVIGNSTYEHAPQLANPVNDSRDIANAFSSLGYQAVLVLDASRSELLDALRRFRADSLGAEHAIIYFAGHGVELDRQNFVIPVDAELKADYDVTFEAIPMDILVAATKGARDLQLVVLDACRDNPFLEQMTRTVASRSFGQGLAFYEPDGNSLVAYAAREGTVALDGEGGNSPYASAFLKALAEPGLEIGQFFREVRDEVMRTTQGTQEPFLYGSLSAEKLFFNMPTVVIPKPDEASETTVAAANSGLSRETLVAIELAFWESIAKSKEPSDFEEYLARFPNGQFRSLAGRRLASFNVQKEPEGADTEVRAVPEAKSKEVVPLRLSKSAIRDLQARLNILGFSVGVEDGIAGRRTRSAVTAFRQSEGLRGGGEFDAILMERLAARVPDSRLRSSRESKARTAAPAVTEPKPAVRDTPAAVPDAPVAAAPQPSASFAGFVGRTYCRKLGNLVQNGKNSANAGVANAQVNCFRIASVSQTRARFVQMGRRGMVPNTATWVRNRTGDRSFGPLQFPSAGTGTIIVHGNTYVQSPVYGVDGKPL